MKNIGYFILCALIFLFFILIVRTTSSQSITCDSCLVSNCICSISNCDKGAVNIYDISDCSNVPLSQVEYANGRMEWAPEQSMDYYLRVLCDDKRQSDCIVTVAKPIIIVQNQQTPASTTVPKTTTSQKTTTTGAGSFYITSSIIITTTTSPPSPIETIKKIGEATNPKFIKENIFLVVPFILLLLFLVIKFVHNIIQKDVEKV